MEKKQLIKTFLEKDILCTEQSLNLLPENANFNDFLLYIEEKNIEEDIIFINDDLIHSFLKSNIIPNIPNNVGSSTVGNYLEKVKLISKSEEPTDKKSIKDFITYYNLRYSTIKSYLMGRQDLEGLVSISRIKTKREKEKISVIGMVKEKTTTKNNSVILTLEDPTGEVSVIITENNPEVNRAAKVVIEDEVIGVVGISGNNAIFANKIIVPDVPLIKELKKSPDEEYAVFISDIHVGSKYFLKDNFLKFIKWLNGEVGNDAQKEMVKKVKYIFAIGDLVDGVGIYPGQEKELELLDVKDQYTELTKYFAMIPKDKSIIICPGNHDATRLEEPQPPISREYAPGLHDLPNCLMVANPSIINVGARDTFEGIDVMMYHGFSFDYFISNIDEIRNNGGYDRGDLVMKFLLQRRHLCPTQGSTVYIPNNKEDPMIIKKIPDLLCTGHIHKCAVSNYRNVTLISSSCWQDTTPFQKKLGHNPEPCRVPMINLKTREPKIMRF